MISCSRWYSSDGSIFYIRLSGDYPSNLTMRHFNNEGEPVDFRLTGEGPTFSYEIGKLEPLDAWELLSGSTVIAAHGDPDDKNPDDHSMGSGLNERGEMPKGPFDDMRAESFTFNKHTRLLETQDQEEYVDYSSYKLTTITPAFTNEIVYDVTVEDELLFSSVNPYAPRQMSQEELDELLADPQKLFEQGNAEAVQVGSNIVVPYSDGETTWTKSYVKADVYSSEVSYGWNELVHAEPEEVGTLVGNVSTNRSWQSIFNAIVGRIQKYASDYEYFYETPVYNHVPVDNEFMSDGMIFLKER